MASEVAKALRDRRLTAWNEAKGVLEAAENRDLSVEENQKYDAAMTEVDALDSRLKTVLDSEARSREADEAYNSIAGREQKREVPGDDRDAQLRSFLTSEQGEPGYKRSVEIQRASSSQLNLRSLGSAASASVTSGSNTVPTDFYDQLISYLIEVSGILQTGPTVLRTAGGETIQIPVVANHVTAGGPIPQATAIPNSDPGFSTKSLGAAKFGAMVSVSRELIDDTAVDLLGYLAMSAGRAIGNAFGNALVNGGSGITGGLLQGVTNHVAGAAASGNGAIVGGPDYNSLVDLEYSVIAPYRASRNAYWLAKDQTVGALRKLTDGNGRPIWEPSPQVGAPDMLLGKPLVADPFMPGVGTNNQIVFGDFSQYFVRLVGGLRFERSDDFHFDTDLVTFRAVLRGDGNLVDANALSALHTSSS